MISVREVTVRLAERLALDSITLDIADGEVVALVGANGAGKTTLLRVIATEIAPTRGTVEVAGHDTRRAPRRVREQLGVMPHTHGLYPRLTVREQLRVFGLLYGLRGRDLRTRVEELLTLSDLDDRRNDLIAALSAGMLRRLSFVCALVHHPTAIVLDEPTDNMDDASRTRTYAIIDKLRKQRASVLLATHDADEAVLLADRIATLNSGRMVGCALNRHSGALVERRA